MKIYLSIFLVLIISCHNNPSPRDIFKKHQQDFKQVVTISQHLKTAYPHFYKFSLDNSGVSFEQYSYQLNHGNGSMRMGKYLSEADELFIKDFFANCHIGSIAIDSTGINYYFIFRNEGEDYIFRSDTVIKYYKQHELDSLFYLL